MEGKHRRQHRYFFGEIEDIRREYNASGSRFYLNPLERCARLSLAGIASPANLSKFMQQKDPEVTELKI